MRRLKEFEVTVTSDQPSSRTIVAKLDVLSRRNPTPRIHLPAKARRAGGVEKVAAAPSLHWQPVETAMNEAETRAEHIDPALKAAGWGVVEGSRIRREYPITLGRIEGHGRRGKALTADYVLVYRNPSSPSSRPRRGMRR